MQVYSTHRVSHPTFQAFTFTNRCLPLLSYPSLAADLAQVCGCVFSGGLLRWLKRDFRYNSLLVGFRAILTCLGLFLALRRLGTCFFAECVRSLGCSRFDACFLCLGRCCGVGQPSLLILVVRLGLGSAFSRLCAIGGPRHPRQTWQIQSQSQPMSCWKY